MAAFRYFTPRELEMLALVARGKASKEIAAELGVSYSTVAQTIHHALMRNDLHSRSEAVAVALDHGLLEVPAPVYYGHPAPVRGG